MDFTIYRERGSVVVEADEHQHAHYPVSCEAARMVNIFGEQMKQGRAGTLHIVRFNPGPYSDYCEPQKTLLKDRMAALKRTIDNEPALQYNVTYLFYTRTDTPLPDVCFDLQYP